MSGASPDWLKSDFSAALAFLADDCLASAVAGRRSGLGLPAVLELAEPFLDLKTSRMRPAGETDRFDWERGGASSVLLVASCGGELRLSVVSAGKVDERGEGSESCWSEDWELEMCSAWTRGELVVR